MSSDEADPVDAYLRAHFRPDVAADLLAAAQPLMAIAWDEGWQACVNFSIYPEIDGEPTSGENPYRSQS